MTNWRCNPSVILEVAGDLLAAFLNHNKPAAYLSSARAHETLLDKLEDAELIKIVKAGKPQWSVLKIHHFEFDLDVVEEWRKLGGSIQAQFKQQLSKQLLKRPNA